MKEKNTALTKAEWRQLLLKRLAEQGNRCVLTGLPFGFPGESEDVQMRPSVDRIDSGGQYEPENIQIVCRFINRWKGADPDPLARRLIDSLRGSAGPSAPAS